MNRERRKRLEEAINKIEELQIEIQSIAEEERESYDNLPESLQDGERGQQISDNADNLEYADSDFDSLLETLREIV